MTTAGWWRAMNDLYARLNVFGDNTKFIEGVTRLDAERQYEEAVKFVEDEAADERATDA